MSIRIPIAGEDGEAMQTRGIAIFGILALTDATPSSDLPFLDKNRIYPGGHYQGGIRLLRVGKKLGLHHTSQ